jgi:cytochrome P450
LFVNYPVGPELDESDLPSFPMPRACPFAPPEQYEKLREESPISRAILASGQRVWLVTRHKDIRVLLSDPRFSSNPRHPGFPLQSNDQAVVSDMKPALIEMDPVDHGPARRAVGSEFTVSRMRNLQPRIQEIVDEHIDAMSESSQPVDLVRALCLPVPSLVICELLGVPYSDHDFFQGNSSQLLRRTVTQKERMATFGRLYSYVDDLVAVKERDPGDDLLGRQVVKQQESGFVDHDALVSLALLLLIAGHETVANVISLGTLALLRDSRQREALRLDPSKTPGAVEEMLRYFTVAELRARVAIDDIEFCGVTIRKGEGVLALGNSANRDPSVFPDPDSLNIERSGRNHVAFGFGPHQCLGQNLARMELQIVFDTLLRRLPDMRLATNIDELSFKDDAAIYGLYDLPVLCR